MKFYFYPIDVESNGGVAFGIHCFTLGIEIGFIWYNLIIVWGEE